MKTRKLFLVVLVTTLILSLSVAMPVYAQGGETPPDSTVPAQVGLLDFAFFIAAVAFFKARFGWEDNAAFAAAVGVGLVLALLPQISEALPTAAPWLTTLANFLKFVIGGTGAYNAVIDIGSKITSAPKNS